MQCSSLMFWTDWGRRSAIMRARMDGSSKVSIVHKSTRLPNGISLDLVSMRLYWVDAGYDRLETCDINGFSRRTLLANTANLLHPFAVGVVSGYVYWTDWNTQVLFRRELASISDESSVNEALSTSRTLRDRPFGFTVVDTTSPRPGGM